MEALGDILHRLERQRQTETQERLERITEAGGTEVFLSNQGLKRLSKILNKYPEDKLSEYADAYLQGLEDRLADCESCRDGSKCAGAAQPHPGEYLGGYRADGDLVFEHCVKYQDYLLRQRLSAAGVGKRFLSCTFDSYKPATTDQGLALQLCQSYAKSLPSERGLMIAGPVGTGKTHLASAITRCAIEKGVETRFTQVPALLSQIRLAIGQNDEVAKSIVERCGDVPLLVLDDLGSERVTDWVREQIFLIINSRYEEMLPTVVTTNDTLEELEKHVGQRIISRLMETCQGLILDGEDFRKEAV
jgi:DNA replication protein DnaC